MQNNPIKTHAGARTAAQYLEILEDEVSDEDICLVEMQHKPQLMFDIVVALHNFHLDQSIRLVINNDKKEEAECS